MMTEALGNGSERQDSHSDFILIFYVSGPQFLHQYCDYCPRSLGGVWFGSVSGFVVSFACFNCGSSQDFLKTKVGRGAILDKRELPWREMEEWAGSWPPDLPNPHSSPRSSSAA